MNKEQLQKITVGVGLFAVVSVSATYAWWSIQHDVSQASGTSEIVAANEVRSSASMIYFDARAGLLDAIDAENTFDYNFHMQNLKNRMLATVVPPQDFQLHLERIRTLESLLESGFFDRDAVAELDVLF